MSMKIEVEKKLGKKSIDSIMNSELSKSGKMKELFLGGLDVKEIKEIFSSKGIEVRYNFVYNVCSNMVNIKGIEVVKNREVGKVKEKVIELLVSGKKKVEISKELGVNYNYIYKIERDYKLLVEKKEVVK